MGFGFKVVTSGELVLCTACFSFAGGMGPGPMGPPMGPMMMGTGMRPMMSGPPR